MSSTDITIIVALAMTIGLIGTLVPLIPGLLLIFGAAIFYGVREGFGGVGTVAMVIITGLFAFGSLVSLILARRSAARVGAPRMSMLAAVIGGIVGLFVIPILGFVIGAVFGMLLAERARLHDWSAAWRVTFAAARGYLLGMLVEAACGAGIFATWAVWALLD